MSPGRIPPIRFDVDVVREKDDSWTGRLHLNDHVVHESRDNSHARQAQENVVEDFILLFRKMLEIADQAVMAEVDDEEEVKP